jgi:hypothetical protein
MIRDMSQRLISRDPDAELKKKLAEEARAYSSVIIKKLEQLDIAYRYQKGKDKFETVQRVKFQRAVTTPEAIYLQIDTVRLPRGISLSHINSGDVLKDLSVSCRRPVRFKMGTESGAWLIVEREGGVWGIPRKLEFKDVVKNYPRSSKKSLVVPLGVGENRRLVYKSLAEMPHALVGGATGGGKTTLLHAWICSLLRHNSPDDLRIAFIDLKGGAEASFYAGIPHLIEDEELGLHGTISEREDVVPMLQYFYDVVEGRLRELADEGVQNIAAWNYHHRKKGHWARLVLFVDEMANIMLDKRVKKDAQTLLADISARGRAPGVHVVLATQRPEVAVIPGLIKANLDARLAFRMTDNSSSMVILDDTSAARFDADSPPGRFIYKRGLDRENLQASWITPGQIKATVKRAIANSKAEAESNEDDLMAPEEIFSAVLKNLDGAFSLRKTYELMEGRVGWEYLNEVGKAYEGKTVEVDGQTYVLKPGGGPKPRQLEPIGSGS